MLSSIRKSLNKIIMVLTIILFTNTSLVFADINIDMSLFGIDVSEGQQPGSMKVSFSDQRLGEGTGGSYNNQDGSNPDNIIVSTANSLFNRLKIGTNLIIALATVTLIGLFIFYLILVGSPTSNERERENYLHGLGWVGISLGIIGSVGAMFFLLIGLF